MPPRLQRPRARAALAACRTFLPSLATVRRRESTSSRSDSSLFMRFCGGGGGAASGRCGAAEGTTRAAAVLHPPAARRHGGALAPTCTRLYAFIQRSMGASTSLSSFLLVSLLILASSSALKSVPPMGSTTWPCPWLALSGTTLPPPVSSYTRGSGADSTALVDSRMAGGVGAGAAGGSAWAAGRRRRMVAGG